MDQDGSTNPVSSPMAQDARTMTANSSDPFLNRLVSNRSQMCVLCRANVPKEQFVKYRNRSWGALIDVTWRGLPFWFRSPGLMYPVWSVCSAVWAPVSAPPVTQEVKTGGRSPGLTLFTWLWLIQTSSSVLNCTMMTSGVQLLQRRRSQLKCRCDKMSKSTLYSKWRWTTFTTWVEKTQNQMDWS